MKVSTEGVRRIRHLGHMAGVWIWSGTFVGSGGGGGGFEAAEAAVEELFEAGEEVFVAVGAAGEGAAAEEADFGGVFGGGEQGLPGGGGAVVLPEVEVEEAVAVGGEAEVGLGARPLILFGFLDHAGADGVEFDVGEGAVEVGFGQGAAVVAVLPEVAGAVALGVDHLGVAAVGAAEEDGEGVFVFGDGDEMDVVGHLAPGEEADLGVGEIFAEQAEVGGVIGVTEEDALAVGAALDDVIGDSGEDTAGISGHLIREVWNGGESSPKEADKIAN